jgi:hypothetical protein
VSPVARFLLSAVLLVWRPLDFAIELPSTLPSMEQRGVLGVIELLAHGLVAALAVAAARAIWSGLAPAVLLARLALVASAAATIQSQYWSVLPHQTMPDDKLLLAIVAVSMAVGWLIYLRRFREAAG